MRRVGISGIGIVSVLGSSCESVTESLYQGRSGIIRDESRAQHGFRSLLTGSLGENTAIDLPKLSKKARKTMPDFCQHAFCASMQAIASAKLTPQDMHSERVGLIFGNDSAVSPVFALKETYDTVHETYALGSSHVVRCMNSSVSMNLAVLFGCMGPCLTISAACASGAYAIGQAFDMIRLGRVDRMLVGGVQELNWQSVAAFDGISAFSTNPNPKEASRPFDRLRDGLVPSGGAAALILEDMDTLRKRGAPVFGEILGFGMSCDGTSLLVPDAKGLSRAIDLALKDARQNPAALDLICAHATSTLLGDAQEALALRDIFGESIPLVTAFKSLTGHEFWMSGASQIVYAACMAQGGFIAKTANFTEGDAQTKGIPVLCERKDVPARLVLHNACGFGGTNAALVVRYVSV